MLNGKQYWVEISEDRKLIQLEKDGFSRKVSGISMVKHQMNLLDLKLNDLDYNLYDMAKDSISNSKDLSSRINSLSKFIANESSRSPGRHSPSRIQTLDCLPVKKSGPKGQNQEDF